MDLRFLEGLGGGLTALSQQLTAREMRKLAEEERAAERKRQQEQDALQRAQMSAQSDRSLRSENYREAGASGTKSANDAILNNLALQQGQDEYTDPLTQKVWMRNKGDSPNDQRAAMAQDKLDNSMLLQQERGRTQQALQERDLATKTALYDRASGNVLEQQKGANRRWDTVSGNTRAQQAGADRRDDTGAGGGGTQPVLRPPTEAQAKDAKYYDMMEKAVPVLKSLEGKVRGDRISAAIRSPEFLANRFLTAEEQEYLRAARDFATGIYRPETGASAKPSEVMDVFNRYLTVGGEVPTMRQIKDVAREGKLATQRNAALPALRYYEEQTRVLEGMKKPTGGDALSRLNSLGRP